jgi:hypothetical protein
VKAILLLILKTIGDFFLDAKGDGDPMRTFAIIFFIVGLCEISVFWEMTAGLIAAGILLYILAIWRERDHAKKAPDPTQGVPRS